MKFKTASDWQYRAEAITAIRIGESVNAVELAQLRRLRCSIGFKVFGSRIPRWLQHSLASTLTFFSQPGTVVDAHLPLALLRDEL